MGVPYTLTGLHGSGHIHAGGVALEGRRARRPPIELGVAQIDVSELDRVARRRAHLERVDPGRAGLGEALAPEQLDPCVLASRVFEARELDRCRCVLGACLVVAQRKDQPLDVGQARGALDGFELVEQRHDEVLRVITLDRQDRASAWVQQRLLQVCTDLRVIERAGGIPPEPLERVRAVDHEALCVHRARAERPGGLVLDAPDPIQGVGVAGWVGLLEERPTHARVLVIDLVVECVLAKVPDRDRVPGEELRECARVVLGEAHQPILPRRGGAGAQVVIRQDLDPGERLAPCAPGLGDKPGRGRADDLGRAWFEHDHQAMLEPDGAEIFGPDQVEDIWGARGVVDQPTRARGADVLSEPPRHHSARGVDGSQGVCDERGRLVARDDAGAGLVRACAHLADGVDVRSADGLEVEVLELAPQSRVVVIDLDWFVRHVHRVSVCRAVLIAPRGGRAVRGGVHRVILGARRRRVVRVVHRVVVDDRADHSVRCARVFLPIRVHGVLTCGVLVTAPDRAACQGAQGE